MKNSIFLALLFCGLSASAQTTGLSAAQDIYNSMKADAQRRVTETGAESTKSVGGLNCTEVANSQTNSATYSCEIPITDGSNRALDAEAIFDGLNVDAVKFETNGKKTWTKTVSGLTCIEVRNSMISHTYSCSIFMK